MKFTIKKVTLISILAIISTQGLATDLKLANFMSPNHPYEKGVFKPFAENVAKKTGGKVTVSIFSGGELGPGPKQQYNRVLDGVADIIFGLPGYTASNFPKTLLSELPGVITDENGTATILNNINLLSNEYRRAKLVGIWTNAPNVIYSNKKPIRNLEDIKGLKIRVPSRNAGLVVESWGGTPVSMPVTEVYNAMQTGVIDGTVIDGTAVFAFRLSEVTKYITVGMNTSISTFFMLMNRDSFADLSKDQQKAILDAGKIASIEANKIQRTGASKGLKDFGNTTGKELITLSADAVAAFNKASAPVIGKVIKKHQSIDAMSFVRTLQQSN